MRPSQQCDSAASVSLAVFLRVFFWGGWGRGGFTCTITSREPRHAAWNDEWAVHQDSSLTGASDLVDVEVVGGLAAENRAAREDLLGRVQCQSRRGSTSSTRLLHLGSIAQSRAHPEAVLAVDGQGSDGDSADRQCRVLNHAAVRRRRGRGCPAAGHAAAAGAGAAAVLDLYHRPGAAIILIRCRHAHAKINRHTLTVIAPYILRHAAL